jgi:hypothetical protein
MVISNSYLYLDVKTCRFLSKRTAKEAFSMTGHAVNGTRAAQSPNIMLPRRTKNVHGMCMLAPLPKNYCLFRMHGANSDVHVLRVFVPNCMARLRPISRSQGRALMALSASPGDVGML